MNLGKTLESVDKFYVILSIVLVLMAILVIFSFRGIFNALLSAYEIDQGSISVESTVEKQNLNEAYDWVYNRGSIRLEITD